MIRLVLVELACPPRDAFPRLFFLCVVGWCVDIKDLVVLLFLVVFVLPLAVLNWFSTCFTPWARLHGRVPCLAD